MSLWWLSHGMLRIIIIFSLHMDTDGGKLFLVQTVVLRCRKELSLDMTSQKGNSLGLTLVFAISHNNSR